MSIAGGPDIVENGLVLHLDAADTNSYPGSGTVWTDLSGNGNNGTLTNGPVFNSANKGYFSFDGTNDYVNTSLLLPSPSITSTTFNLIFSNNSTGAGSKGLIGSSNYNTDGFSIGFINGQNNMRNTYNASGTAFENNFNYTTVGIIQGTFIFNGRNISVYKNTSLINSVTASFDAAARSAGITIGYNQQGGWSFSQVDIYAVRIYNRALSTAEILQNYNATKGRFGL